VMQCVSVLIADEPDDFASSVLLALLLPSELHGLANTSPRTSEVDMIVDRE
jgi:hypothetical protein